MEGRREAAKAKILAENKVNGTFVPLEYLTIWVWDVENLYVEKFRQSLPNHLMLAALSFSSVC